MVNVELQVDIVPAQQVHVGITKMGHARIGAAVRMSRTAILDYVPDQRFEYFHGDTVLKPSGPPRVNLEDGSIRVDLGEHVVQSVGQRDNVVAFLEGKGWTQV